MSFPTPGKVKITTPQRDAGLPTNIGKAGSYGGGSQTQIKGPLKNNPAPGKAPKPDQSGNKIKTVIQTGTAASKRGK